MSYEPRAPIVAPYGSWRSSIAPEAVVAGFVRLAETRWDGDDLLWLEGRPDDGGRATLVRLRPGGVPEDISPTGVNVRTRVHEYGGAPYLVAGDLVVVSDFATGRLLRVAPGRSATPITPEGAFRFADLELDAARGRVLAVREDHTGPGEAVNTIVAIPLDGAAAADPASVEFLVAGSDFFSSPRLAPDGGRLCWLRWDHPNLPWDGTECVVAELDAGGVPGPGRVVAGDAATWTAQPRWAPDGSLIVASEPGEWIGLHRWDGERLTQLTAGIEAEFAEPDWNLGYSSYGVAGDGSLVAIGRADGRDRLWRVDPAAARPPTTFELPFTELAWLAVRGQEASAIVAAANMFRALVRIDLSTGAWTIVRLSSDLDLDLSLIAAGEPVEFPTTGNRTAHGIFYRPTNPAFRAPDGELPPLVVTSHGGPTSAASTGLHLSFQVLASRGIAVLDIDYGGSTGYGKTYRKRLEGTWGITDVDDCVAGALEMARRGEADGARLAIEGGSASGFTTLAALAFRDVFRAGVSYFGIGNLEAFVAETHKFESRYLDRLVGPYPAARDVYRARSPILHAEGFSCPVLVLQGLDDHVVPPSEAERIVAALAAKGIPHVYLPFEGEDHGFRQAANIVRSLQAELAFYGRVFGFVPADDLPALPWRAVAS
ncbi:MAG TPA: prolyl oligopeptidase family serine peptidase [Candidatus Nanopelagicales bacterium]|nr:prolyl oligopeptidase family serine peptidase [Candidatus Nanopelagicales bacterium]